MGGLPALPDGARSAALLHARHANAALPHDKILQAVWGPDYGDEVEYLRVFVNQLRKKIEPDPARPRFILTEPWLGYRFDMRGEAVELLPTQRRQLARDKRGMPDSSALHRPWRH